MTDLLSQLILNGIERFLNWFGLSQSFQLILNGIESAFVTGY